MCVIRCILFFISVISDYLMEKTNKILLFSCVAAIFVLIVATINIYPIIANTLIILIVIVSTLYWLYKNQFK